MQNFFIYIFVCRNTTYADEPMSAIALWSERGMSSEGWQSCVFVYRKLYRFTAELSAGVHDQSGVSAAVSVYATKVSRSMCRSVRSERSVLGSESPRGLCVHRRIHRKSIQRLRTSTWGWVHDHYLLFLLVTIPPANVAVCIRARQVSAFISI